MDDDSDEEDERAAAKKKPPKAGKKLRPQDIAGQEVTTVLEEDGNRIEPFNMNEELEEGYGDTVRCRVAARGLTAVVPPA